MRTKVGVDWPAAVAKFAERQHGVVARNQLRSAGVGEARIRGYLERGQLIALHRGVYAVGHAAISQRGREQAAVLATGAPGAYVSHLSAARMWGLLLMGAAECREPVHVSVTQRQPRIPGVNVHRVKPVFRRHRKRIDGVPVSSVARTLLDMAGDLDSEFKKKRFSEAVNEAKARGLVKRHHFEAVLKDYPKVRGTVALRMQLDDLTYSRSAAEKKVKRLLRNAGLPMPQQNAPLGEYEVDFYWPEFDLILEFNGFAFHSSREKFESDHVRIGNLRHARHTVIEISWDLLENQPDTVVEWVTTAIAEARSSRACAVIASGEQ